MCLSSNLQTHLSVDRDNLIFHHKPQNNSLFPYPKTISLPVSVHGATNYSGTSSLFLLLHPSLSIHQQIPLLLQNLPQIFPLLLLLPPLKSRPPSSVLQIPLKLPSWSPLLLCPINWIISPVPVICRLGALFHVVSLTSVWPSPNYFLRSLGSRGRVTQVEVRELGKGKMRVIHSNNFLHAHCALGTVNWRIAQFLPRWSVHFNMM